MGTKKYYHMKQLVLVILVVINSFMSCTDQSSSQEEEWQALVEQYERIVLIANSETCIESDNWVFTAIGSKACGGPTGYIAYSLNIDAENFLNQVASYTAAQNTYNIKWGIISDCSVPLMPSEVVCVNGNAEFIY